MTAIAPATIYADLAREVDVAPEQTVSKTLYQDDHVKVVLFGFGAGQELSEHTASVPAMLHFLGGDAIVSLGTDTLEAKEGTFVHMPAHLPHAITAVSDTRMLLVMLKGAKS